ncbi:MGDG synthase family glycosyltransferase [Fictibacillus barbaricus]|uniref:UDP-N-acetylglucosamine:LPS N-acetylglucosamine transferase n=1 Tax=Fictibacillus barbaricus TaxID=182136 RepID=A0ABU1TW80_9BACL|nr:glycosyltransferase [Fictibacillus barbaricus]MDR7071470.1 UDP-N-acetylglucosamine:LPS N-acetylglucosamine transferase [Fictibacillus barbaricus]
MKKILFLPLFQMPSGHHHVADSLIDSIKSHSDQIECCKLDFLHYVNPGLEKLVSSIYLKWISASPATYKKAYYHYSYTNSTNNLSLSFYEKLFLRRMEKLILRENPDLIICTHSFPSFLLSVLKEKGKLNIPVINVYTDFFINSVWGMNGIDYHLVPDHAIKSTLVEKYGVPAKNIKVSGIPIHEKLEKKLPDKAKTKSINILIAGGSSGLGDMTGFLEQARKQQGDIKFTILCGKNKNLYDAIRSWNHPSIQCVPYLSSKEEMNHLYEHADAIVTKPGGVTISECLKKGVPIFVHSALPGQEDVNLNVLLDKRLIYKISKESSYIEQIVSILKDDKEMADYRSRVDLYRSSLELSDSNGMSSFIYAVLQQSGQQAINKDSLTKKHWAIIRPFKKRRSFAE